MRRPPAAISVLLALSALAAACRSGSGASPSPSGTSLLPASPLALPTFDPGQFRRLLAQLRGKPVVITLWASWCGPCIREAPELASVARTYGDRVQFVGVDELDHLGPARAFVRRFGLPFPSVSDPDAAIRDDLRFVAMPVTQILNESGQPVQTWAGPTFTAQALGHALERLVSGPSSSPQPS